jgi:hypothetical protein
MDSDWRASVHSTPRSASDPPGSHTKDGGVVYYLIG